MKSARIRYSFISNRTFVVQQPRQFDMEGIGQAVPTHAVAAFGGRALLLNHGVKRFQTRFQIRHIDEDAQNHAFHFDTRVEHVFHFFQVRHMDKCAAVWLQIDDFIVRQKR